jgi:hypothetical protein
MWQVKLWWSLECGLEYAPPRAMGDEMSNGLATWTRAQSASYSYGDGWDCVNGDEVLGWVSSEKATLMLTENELNTANLVWY